MAIKTGTENKTGENKQSSDRARGLARRDPYDPFGVSPFAMMRRMQEDMDRLFGGFGPSRVGFSSAPEWQGWAPAIDAFHRDSEFVIRADVPGLSREDLAVEIGDDALTIRGERKYDREEEKEGVLHSERGYGTFSRVVPLPEGVMVDGAKATFKNGVLEVVMPAPPQDVRRGRKLEIKDAGR